MNFTCSQGEQMFALITQPKGSDAGTPYY